MANAGCGDWRRAVAFGLVGLPGIPALLRLLQQDVRLTGRSDRVDVVALLYRRGGVDRRRDQLRDRECGGAARSARSKRTRRESSRGICDNSERRANRDAGMNCWLELSILHHEHAVHDHESHAHTFLRGILKRRLIFDRSEEHTSELQTHSFISYAV